ncbi:MAG: carbon-nitrogen hydrolase family protein, partial [Planctomycetaceae bacterium]|nr:carbon-nitrogen hydrolase family protein [Planctomycetaceae bacterium]
MRIAAVQMDVRLADVAGNLSAMTRRAEEAHANGATLVIFPECALTGYCFDSRAEALPYAQPIPGPATEAMQALCRELGIYVVFGLLEAAGDQLFNAAAMIGPKGLIASYRKVHLPWLGIDRYTDYGDQPF